MNISSKSFYMRNENCGFFMSNQYQLQNPQVLVSQKIHQLEIGFSTISIKDIVKDSTLNETILTFNVDEVRNKLILIVKKNDLENHQNVTRFKIFCLDKK